jgi:hypothetical protein
MHLRIVMVMLLLVGCTAAYRTTSGGATAREGVSSGTTGSLYFSDRGGILTRAGLAALGMVAAFGAVRDVKSESTVTNNGDGTVTVHTKQSGTFNAHDAQAAADILNAASDPRQNFGGLTGGLEIASTSLGGDTSGWMFEFGYAYAKTFHNRWGLNLAGKLMFGGFTQHDRMITKFDTSSSGTGVVTTTMGDSGYDFVGPTLRLGFPYRVRPDVFVEPVLKLALNWYPRGVDNDIQFDPSVWQAGVRVTAMKYVYVEIDGRFSEFRESATSYGLEVGLAF